MTETEKKMLKCMESLHSILAIVAVAVDDGRYSQTEANAIERAFSTFNAAHYDLIHGRTEPKEASE